MPTKKEILLRKLLEEQGLDPDKVLDNKKDTSDTNLSIPEIDDVEEVSDPAYKTDNPVFVIAGMPNSGEELLSAILSQNSKYTVSDAEDKLALTFQIIRNSWQNLSVGKYPDKESLDVVRFLEDNWEKIFAPTANQNGKRVLKNISTAIKEVYEYMDEDLSPPERLRQVLRSILNAYYPDAEGPIFLRHVNWLNMLPTLEFALGGVPKVLVPVRNFGAILAEEEIKERKERAYKQTTTEASDYVASQSIMGRVQIFLRDKHTIGLTVNRIHEAYYGGRRESMCFVEYEKLVEKSHATMNKLLKFCGEAKCWNIDKDDLIDGDTKVEIPKKALNRYSETYPDGMADAQSRMWDTLKIKF